MSLQNFHPMHYRDALRDFKREAGRYGYGKAREPEIVDLVTTKEHDVSAETGNPQKLTFFGDLTSALLLSDDPKILASSATPNDMVVGIYALGLQVDVAELNQESATDVEIVEMISKVYNGLTTLRVGGDRLVQHWNAAIAVNTPSARINPDNLATATTNPAGLDKSGAMQAYPTPRIIGPGSRFEAWTEYNASALTNDNDVTISLRMHAFIARK